MPTNSLTNSQIKSSKLSSQFNKTSKQLKPEFTNLFLRNKKGDLILCNNCGIFVGTV